MDMYNNLLSKSTTMNYKKTKLNISWEIVKNIPYRSALLEGTENKQTLTEIHR